MNSLQLCVFLGAALAAADSQMNVLQWNPHWECFSSGHDNCKTNALKALTERLTADTDFANVVMLENSGSWSPPSGFTSMESKCGQDVTALFWNTNKWKKSTASGSSAPNVCLQNGNDRASLIQAFENVNDASQKVVVIGAHFPHPGSGNVGVLTQPLAAAKAAVGTANVILIADTNEPMATTSADVMKLIGITDQVISTDLEPSCCNNDGFTNGGFDRIISTFGSNMATNLYDLPTPSWVTGAFHRAVRGTFTSSSQLHAMAAATPAAKANDLQNDEDNEDDEEDEDDKDDDSDERRRLGASSSLVLV